MIVVFVDEKYDPVFFSVCGWSLHFKSNPSKEQKTGYGHSPADASMRTK